MNLTKLLLFYSVSFAFFACQESKKDKIIRLVKEWQGKEIVFPANMTFTIYGKDTVDYKILVYVDSIGCTSCKLQLPKWKEFICKLDSSANKEIPVLFFFQPKDKKEIQFILKRDKFNYPVCLDTENELERKNHFPSLLTRKIEW